MMYMPDALKAAIQIMETDSSHLTHRVGYNVSAMSFCPQQLYDEIRRWIPDFKIVYKEAAKWKVTKKCWKILKNALKSLLF